MGKELAPQPAISVVALPELQYLKEKPSLILDRNFKFERSTKIEYPMTAAKLIGELTALVAKHGDHEVTIVLGVHEYSMRDPSYNTRGALAGYANLQRGLPMRFVLEGKDNL